MTGIGLIVFAFAYAIIYWGINAIQEQSQDTFSSYIFPFSK